MPPKQPGDIQLALGECREIGVRSGQTGDDRLRMAQQQLTRRGQRDLRLTT
jgi:hypothetical protein